MLNFSIKVILSLLIVLSFSKTSFCQEDTYASVAEVIPQPVGGINAIYKHINYPKAAKVAGISGKVYILAFINENGNVDDTKIVKGLGGGCDEEVTNAVKSWKFTPGENNGVRIKTKLVLAFTFKE